MKKIFILFVFIQTSILGQNTWQATPNLDANTNGQRFDDVFFLNENLGWAANGYYASIHKTTDGGLTWVEQLNESQLGGSYYFRNVEFIDENVGFIGTLNGTHFKTNDGGETWTTINNIPQPAPGICGLDAVGENTIYGCGAYFSPAYIIKSNDSGSTWNFIDMSSYANALVEILFKNELEGYVSGKSSTGGVILETTDGGISWTEIYNSNQSGDYVWKLQLLNNNTNVIFGAVSSVNPHLGKLISSNNSGVTWTTFDAPETDIQAVGFISQNHGWMGGHTTGFYETLDGGATWTDLDTGSNLNRIFVINDNIAYACGTSIYKYTEVTLSHSQQFETTKPQLGITLYNTPAKDVLNFEIDFLSDDNIVIDLYTIQGKHLKQIARELIPNSTKKQYSIPVDFLSPGLYILDFHNNTGHNSKIFTKK
ncbi:MAG: hypothetical protein BM564_10680 [Bacteroidetes bacterium MedPE-SWsnd-G2]|mgnify:CR=1 FL=1|nr:MAG: hypothetical protein BM564_10680 [Bacteroidetes bacterium MedPE-SWsnd-G2]